MASRASEFEKDNELAPGIKNGAGSPRCPEWTLYVEQVSRCRNYAPPFLTLGPLPDVTRLVEFLTSQRINSSKVPKG